MLAKMHPPRTTTAAMEESNPQGNIGALRSSRVAVTTSAETHSWPDINGLVHITIVYGSRVTAFLDILQDIEGVESTKRMTATIIDVGVRAEYYHEVYGEPSRTLGIASISVS